MKHLVLVLQLFACFMVVSCSSSSDSDSGKSAKGVKEYQLENGLKILVKPDRRAPVFVSQLWYKVGAS